MSIRALAAATAAGALTVVTAMPAHAAVRPFAPSKRAVGPCLPNHADAVVAGDGVLRGFAVCFPSLMFFSQDLAAGTAPVAESTPFAGNVLGVAQDTTGTYVLYWDDTAVRVGKRTTAGGYVGQLVHAYTSEVDFPSGDIVARDGQWTAVWSEQLPPGDKAAQRELFTAGSAQAVRRLTTTAGNIDDVDATLAFAGATVVLVWTRRYNPGAGGPSDLHLAKMRDGTWFGSRRLISAGRQNHSPDLAVSNSRTYLAWVRDRAIVVADNGTGIFRSHRFDLPFPGGGEPRIATSSSAIFVAWSQGRVAFAENLGDGSVTTGTWERSFVTGAERDLHALAGWHGKATVVYRTPTDIRTITQR